MTGSNTLLTISYLFRLHHRSYKKDQAGVEEQPEYDDSLKDHPFDTAQETPNKQYFDQKEVIVETYCPVITISANCEVALDEKPAYYGG